MVKSLRMLQPLGICVGICVTAVARMPGQGEQEAEETGVKVSRFPRPEITGRKPTQVRCERAIKKGCLETGLLIGP